MSTIYWEKAILSSPAVVNGRGVAFEALANNHGVLALDTEKDADLIAGLDALRARRVGGVGRINEEKYLALKKKFPWKPPEKKSWLDEPLKRNGKSQLPKKAAVPLVKAKAPLDLSGPDPASKEPEVPQRPPDQPDFRSSNFRPATRKLSAINPAADI